MNKIEVAARFMQGILANSDLYKPRHEDRELHWHKALAKEALDIVDALEEELVERYVDES